MTSELAIMTAIRKIVRIPSIWTIGVTDDPDRRRIELGNPDSWYQWDAPTEQAAKDIETHYVSKGMKGDTAEVDRTANSVYMFVG